MKHLSLPITKTNLEYYLSKISIHNFGIHDLKSNKATMFLYSENYSAKGPNEVISCINYYLNSILDKNVKQIHIFSDNCYSQNKNKYLWAFYDHLVKIGKFDKITIYYPFPGHSLVEIDGDFGKIEINRKRTDKIYIPDQYIQLIKNSNLKNPYNLVYVNYPLNHNLKNDGIPIIKVKNYKKGFSQRSPIIANGF
jgi:hypothetical protein